MIKAIKDLKSGNYKVVDNQGVSVTTHFVECLEREIADLEAKFAESEEFIQGYRKECAKIQIENVKLNQQLAEKKKQCQECKHLNKKIELNIQNKLMAELSESEEKINMLEEHKFYADNIIQAYADKCKNADQDKTSFAVEKLEKVKETMSKSNESGYIIRFASMNDRDKFNEIIDNQIEQLKGEK